MTGLLFVADGLLVLVFHLSIARFYGDARAATTMLTAFLASGALVSILGIAMLVARRPAIIYAVGHGRAIGTFVVPGEFAGYLLFLIPTAVGVALVSRRPWLRGLAALAALAGVVALAATYSRAGWLGFAVGGAFFIFMQRRSALLGAVLGLALVVGLVTISVFNGHHNPSEYFTRLGIWRAGLRTAQLFPVTGVGPGSFRLVYPALRPPDGEPTAFHAHNYVLTSFAETGLVGLATLGALWYCFARAMRGAMRGADGRRRTFALAIVAGFVATWPRGRSTSRKSSSSGSGFRSWPSPWAPRSSAWASREVERLVGGPRVAAARRLRDQVARRRCAGHAAGPRADGDRACVQGDVEQRRQA